MAEMLGPYELGRVHHADCREAMAGLPDACVDAVVTDPPYGLGYAPWDGSIPPQSLLSDALRLARGPVVMFGAGRADLLLSFAAYVPQPMRLLIWTPMFSLAQSRHNRVFYRFHPIWIWRMADANEGFASDVLRDNTEGHHDWNHPATKPVALMERIVGGLTPPGSVVLDCFAGSGTTGCACIRTGRRFLGFEIEQRWVDLANRRIAAEHERIGEVRPSDAKAGQQVGLLTKVPRG